MSLFSISLFGIVLLKEHRKWIGKFQLQIYKAWNSLLISNINPRLTKPFCNTVYRGWLSPRVNLKTEHPTFVWLVPWWSYGSPLSIHTKISNHSNGRFSVNMAKHMPNNKNKLSEISLKCSKYQNFTRFLAYKRMTFLTFTVCLKTVQARTFFLMTFLNTSFNLQISHVFSMGGGYHLRTQWLWRLTLAPGWGMIILFFFFFAKWRQRMG